MKKLISTILLFQFLLGPVASSASSGEEKIREREIYESKRCGTIKLVEHESLDFNAEPNVCRLDAGLLDESFKTQKGETEIYYSSSMLDMSKSTSKIIDQILLDKILVMAKKRLEGFNLINNLPESEDKKEILEEINKFKELLLNSKKGAIHQIRTILSVYPDIQDELIKQNPDYKALICKYEVWKHKREIFLKIAKISSKIVSIAVLMGAIVLPVVGIFGYISVASLGPLFIAMGGAQIGFSSANIMATILNWDEVRTGRMAKKLIEADEQIGQYIKVLQKDPQKNSNLILQLRPLLLSETTKKELKELKKIKNNHLKSVITNSLRVFSGIALIAAGNALNSHFKDFKTNDPAEVTNTENINPVVGPNDPSEPGGFLTDDGGGF